MAFDISSCSNITVAIDSSKVDSTLTNFPVAIDLDDEASALVSSLGANNLKMAVYSGSTELYVEIECWEAGNHVIHTKVPSISTSADTELTLYYDATQDDNSDYIGVTGSTPGKAVWDSDFVAVYHMAQDPSGSAPQLLDSTSNGSNLNMNGSMLSSALTDGDLGKAITFDGSNDFFSTSTPLSTPTEVTVSALVSIDASASSNDGILSQYDTGEDKGWMLFSSETEVRFDGKDSSTYESAAVTDDIRGDGWNFICGRKSGANWLIDLNATTSATTASTTGSIQTASGITSLGNIYSGTSNLDHYLKGLVGAVRVSKIARSDAWIKATNANLKKELVSYSSASSSTHAPIVVQNGVLFEMPPTEIIVSAISDTNDKFTAETMDGAFDEIGESLTALENKTATDMPVDASGFSGNLSSTDTDVQAALGTLDGMVVGSSSGGGAIDYANPVSVTAAVTLTSTSVGKLHVCSDAAAIYTVSLPTSGLSPGDLLAFSGVNALTYPVILDAGADANIGAAQTKTLFFDQQTLIRWDGADWIIVADEHLILEDRIISVATTLSNASLHAIINALPKNLNGASITFQLADGTHTGKTFLFSDFVAGNITVQGNTSESGLHTDQAVIIDNSGVAEEDKKVINFDSCSCSNTVNNVKIIVPDFSYASGVYGNNTPSVTIAGCYFTAANSSSGTVTGVNLWNSNGYVNNSYFGDINRAISAFAQAIIYSNTNDDTGDVSTALFASGGVIMKANTQPSGTTNEYTWGGGVIR